MAGEWRDATLSDLVAIQRGHDLTETERHPGTVPVFGSAGQNGLHDKALAPGPGVVIGRSGASFGRISFSEVPYWPHNTTLYVTDFKENDPRFVYYCLSCIDFSHYNSGSAQQSLNRNYIYSAPLLIPDLGSQRAIARILGALDDKIELNRRMNERLEAMARAIFKDWFVDFGPIRAKMEGSAPYLAPDIWSLFPDRLDDEGNPEGWRAGKLGDVAQPVGQSVSPETLDPNTPYIGLEHMPRRSVALSDWAGAGKVTSGKLAFQKRDFLFGKLRPYFHKVGIAPLDGICSTDIVVLKARERSAAAFVLVCISQDEFVAFTDRTSDGTKMPRTSWSRMERYGVCLPDGAALEAFNALANPMLDRIVANIHESRTLAATRELLLPKLMSGEVRVSEASAAVEHRLPEAR